MVVALSQPSKNTKSTFVTVGENQLHLKVTLSVTLGITAEQAKRKVTRFLLDEISLLLMPQTPLLIVTDQDAILWRFPIALTMGQRGKVGQVGEIDIDAKSGELLLTHDQIEDIKTHARLLARNSSPATNN